jgi:hypothetical protein
VKHKLTNRWGIELAGHAFDLADWSEALKPSFEPYVEFHAGQHVLRWSGFEACQTAVEVRDEAIPLVERLNAVMAITKDTRPIEFNGRVIEFGPDGTPHRTFSLSSGTSEGRSRAAAVGVVIGPDGQEISQSPRSSPAQHWVDISEDDELLADALISLLAESGSTFTRQSSALRTGSAAKKYLRSLVGLAGLSSRDSSRPRTLIAIVGASNTPPPKCLWTCQRLASFLLK